MTPQERAAMIDDRLSDLKDEAVDPFYSAKEVVSFRFHADPQRRTWMGRFIRHGRSGYDLIAVEPDLRDEIAAYIFGHEAFVEDARARVSALPIRSDGLVVLDQCATVVVQKFEGTQAAIQARLPTNVVDAYIIENMGYTAETLAALGKATRRDRRREARRRMMAG